MKKLVCDRCGLELTSQNDLNMVLKGMDAWQNSVKSRGEEPRGIFPCENYRNCGGEMIIVDADDGKEKFSEKVRRIFKR